MSNIGNFYSKTYPLNSVVLLPYTKDLYSPGDGTLWLAATGTSSFNYTSDYSYLPDILTSPHPLLPSPTGKGWFNYFSNLSQANISIAYNPSGSLYVTHALMGDSTSGFNYYTSSDGSTWTKRTFPNLLNYSVVVYCNNKFIAIAKNTATNGVITSTDGINWTTSTGVGSIGSNILDVVSNGSVIVIYPITGSQTYYSTNGGSTWTSTTRPTSAAGLNETIGIGHLTWNAGAGLFIGVATSTSLYLTSPDGITWTNRNSETTFTSYNQFSASQVIRFASNSTTTVAAGLGGFFATSTDGLTWSNQGYVSSTIPLNATVQSLHYDGTRFVIRYFHRIFYSTNGTTWTEGKYVLASAYSFVSGNVLFLNFGNSYSAASCIQKISDVTATTPQIVSSKYNVSSFPGNQIAEFIRIK